MSLPTRPARRTAVAALAAGAAAVTSAALLAPATGSASSHREAPYTSTDPSADNTDTYAFVSPEDDGTVTLLASWSPFQEPGGGPNFFPWDTTATYDINVDNDGDARPDVIYRWTFSDVDARGTVDRGAGNGGKGTFLYNDGEITSLTDPDLRFRQTYDLALITMKGPKQMSRLLADDAPVVPNNVGSASVPSYETLRKAGVTSLRGGGVTYAGQSDDPFFLDLRIFDLLYGKGTQTGNDTLEGYNVNTLAIKVPKQAVVAKSDPAANPVIGVWSTTSRAGSRVFAPTNSAPATSVSDSSDTTSDSGQLVQVSRLGNPLVNEAVVPAHLKDYFNRSTPDRDGQFLAKVQDPEVPALVESIFGIPNPNKETGNPAAAKRNDLSAAFLTGFSRDVFAGRTFGGLGAGVVDADLNSLDINAVSPNPVPAEYLRLNVTVPPAASPNRAGVIGGDFAGFPNGRRLGDDVVDIALRVLEGVLVRPEGATKNAVAGLGDGVDANDKPFLNTFPYVADPHSGSTAR